MFLAKTSHLVFALLSLASVTAFDYSISCDPIDDENECGLTLRDNSTDINGIITLFNGEAVIVTVNELKWRDNEADLTASDLLFWETSVGDEIQAEGVYKLSEFGRKLPSSLEVGTIKTSNGGRHTISVKLFVDGSKASTSSDYESYQAGAAIVPLIIVLALAIMTQMVEVSLLTAVFVGACMVSGNLKDGFKSMLDEYILKALADVDHAYVYLFTLFLSGMVGMMEKSGGMIGFTQAIAKYAKSPRAGQFATFAIGCFVFFDDYANTLLAGETMRPLTDLLFISREKLSFIVDATAAPIASLTPISSWVGFEVGEIDKQIQRIIADVGEENLTISSSAMGVFLESIKYRYYSIFMLIL